MSGIVTINTRFSYSYRFNINAYDKVGTYHANLAYYDLDVEHNCLTEPELFYLKTTKHILGTLRMHRIDVKCFTNFSVTTKLLDVRDILQLRDSSTTF